MTTFVNLVYEDAISEIVMIKLLKSFGAKFETHISYPGNGYGKIKKNIRSYNEASIYTTFFVLTDLDNYTCPIALIDDWKISEKRPNFIFRIAIKEVESWLLADREGFAEFTGVSIVNIPQNPDLENDPKQTLINIARRSRKREIREDIVPINDNAQIGPNYNDCLMKYVLKYWDISRASSQSESLRRAIQSLSIYKYIQPR